jgi:anti-sigma regulatory factor (Ser/Thr protein kinase)
VSASRTVTLSAVASQVAQARRLAADFVCQNWGRSDLVDAVRLAVSEASANVVRHAYRHGEGTFELAMAADARKVRMSVIDHGSGFGHPRSADGFGLGISIISRLCDSLEIVSSAGRGTEITMEFYRSADPNP